MNFIITVAHQKGGVGKSTIASNLAVELSKIMSAQVVDLDMQKSISYFNSIRSTNQLAVKYAANFDELKHLVNNNNKAMIIDVGGFDSDLNRAAILAADFLLTPVSDSTIELVGLLSFKNIMQEVRKIRPDLTANVLLNRVHVKTNTALHEINNFINENSEFSLMSSILRDRVEFKKAFEVGKSVNEYSKSGKAATEINNLINEIKDKINGKNQSRCI